MRYVHPAGQDARWAGPDCLIRHEPEVRSRAEKQCAAVRAAKGTGDDVEVVGGDLFDDLRAALGAAPSGHGPIPHQLARSLGRLTFARRFLQESVDHFRRAAELAATAAEAAEDLRSAADCTFVSTTSGPDTVPLLLASAERAGAAGDGNARAIALSRAVETAGRYQVIRGPGNEAMPAGLRRLLAEASAAGDRGDPAVAAALAVAEAWTARPEALASAAQDAAEAARRTGDPVLISAALDAVGFALSAAGRLREARQITRDRLALLAAMHPDDPHAAAERVDVFITSCTDALHAGDLPTALATAQRLPADDLLGSHSYIATSMQISPLVLTGDLDAGLRYAARTWDGWERAGRPRSGWMIPALANAALAHRLRDDRHGFAVWRARVLEVTRVTDRSQEARLAPLVFLDARAAVHAGDAADAAMLADRAVGDFPYAWAAPYALAAGAELAVVAGLPDAAERLAAAAGAAEQNDWAAACLARAEGRLNRNLDAYAATISGWERIGARLERAYTLLLLPNRASEGRAHLAALGLPIPHLGKVQ